MKSIGRVVSELRASEAANIRGLAFKDRLTDLTENFFGPVLDRLLAVYQKSAQSEQLNGTTFLGRAYRVKANIAEANIANIASRDSLVV